VRTYWTPGLARHLVRHPSHALTLWRAGWRLRREGWWRHAPFLPLPTAEYWAFRLTTVNGNPNLPIDPEAMVDAAKWSLRQPVGR
jgi:hypothetical protein